MQFSEPYAFFRQVVEDDLPYFARCMGAGAGLYYAKWNKILETLELQFKDPGDGWRLNTWVMVVERKPVFLLERAGDLWFFTGPPSWGDDARRMMLAWQAALVYFFLRLRMEEVKVSVAAYRQGEVTALERVGGLRERTFADRSGRHYQYSCRMEAFTPVI